MSYTHNMLIVFGDNPDKQLYPYYEEYTDGRDDYHLGSLGYFTHVILGGLYHKKLGLTPNSTFERGQSLYHYDPEEGYNKYIQAEASRAYKKDILNLEDLLPDAFLKRGIWYQNPTKWMDYSIVLDTGYVNRRWESLWKTILEYTKPDTLVSIYDAMS